MGRLIVICEGGEHTVEYLNRNGIYPDMMMFNTVYFRRMLPYLQENDEILIVIKGLTDFNLTDIYTLVSDIREMTNRVKSVRILSNIRLGAVNFSYYLYTGDLFYGTVQEVVNGKLQDIQDSTDKKVKKGKKASVEPTTVKRNRVISQYALYNDKNTKYTVYGEEGIIASSSSDESPVAVDWEELHKKDESEEAILGLILDVQLFKQ